MADGDLITGDGQLQWGRALIDAADIVGADGTTNGQDAIEGLWAPPVKVHDDDRVGPGQWPGRRDYDKRQITVPILNGDKASFARLLRELYPPDPNLRRNLVFQGFGWPTGHKYVARGLVSQAKSSFGRDQAIGDAWEPAVTWDCHDPFIYGFTAETVTLHEGDTVTFTSSGTHPSVRTTFDFWGPLGNPGLRSVTLGAGLVFDGLLLGEGEVVHVECDPWGLYGIGSFTHTQDQLCSLAVADVGSSNPGELFPVIGGAQQLEMLGAGGGTVTVTAYPAYATPAVDE